MDTKNSQPTAGSAEPNWFEWLHGLALVAELLDPDSELDSVAFQIVGVKGWDDVGARYRDGRIELMQMKHSRTGNTLTFGDLVGAQDGEQSLIASLAGGWDLIREDNPQLKCVLVTNRRGGPNWFQDRPPLEDFLDALHGKLPNAASLEDIVWDGDLERMQEAWIEFTGQLEEISGREIEFLRCLEIRSNQADLGELAEQLDVRLTELTGLPLASISELRNALIGQLRTWTCHTQRESEWIDANQLRKVLLGNEREPTWIGHCDVETPDPFFESRNALIEEIGARIIEKDGPNCFFLSAEPGAGKTSCISKVVRNAPRRWKDQSISLRFYAYRPIVPGRTHFGGDVNDGVTPEALWLGLLWQLRDFLSVTDGLTDLRAPVWLHGLSWQQAREHVLRIASEIGSLWERPFVIAVDGIDHAARARRKGVSEFLGSLPAPEALPDRVHLLLAGQPVEAYPEYPNWLTRDHPSVHLFTMGELDDGDVRMLWESGEPVLSAESTDAVVRILVDFGQRRTLPTVYAVEDIKDSISLEKAEATLESRQISDSLHDYYEGIWSAAIENQDQFLAPTLAATFVFLRERPTPALMQFAFSDFEKSQGEWEAILRRLRPLVRETDDGFEVVHNDLRVYLDGQLSGDRDSRRSAASRLADYYRMESSNRFAAHQTLVSLLNEAGRIDEFADDFDASWVVESGAVGVVGDQLAEQCQTAFSAAIRRRNWLLLHRVSCASLTVRRLEECLENAPIEDGESNQFLPAFLPKEGDTVAFELWRGSDIREIVYTAERLAEADEEARANLILEQWFGSRTVIEVLERLLGSEADGQGGDFDPISQYDPSPVMESWGAVVGRLNIFQEIGTVDLENAPKEIRNGISAFQKGWADSWVRIQNRKFALRMWRRFGPSFVSAWKAAIRGNANQERWGEVRALLKRFETSRENLDHPTQVEFAWLALRSDVPEESLWHEISSETNFGLTPTDNTALALLIPIARIIGYGNPLREPAQVSEDLSALLNRRQYEDQYLSSSRLILRAAVQIGRLWRYIDRKEESIDSILPFEELEPLLDALWVNHPDWRSLAHEDLNLDSRIGGELAETIWRAGCYDEGRISSMAQRVFQQYWGMEVGSKAFRMIFEKGDRQWLEETVSDLVRDTSSNLHAQTYTERPAIFASLKDYVAQFDDQVSIAELESLLSRTRLGYSGHKEYAFGPLCRWLELVTERQPEAWKSYGVRVSRLDQLSSDQFADNRLDDWIYQILGRAAIECGSRHLEALWFHFEEGRDRWGGLSALASAVRAGFESLLKEKRPMSPEFFHSLLALYVGLGRWPWDSASKALESINSEISPKNEPNALLEKARSVIEDFYAQSFTSTPDGEQEEGENAESPLANSEENLDRIRNPDHSGWIKLSDFAALAEAVNAEERTDRDSVIEEALELFAGSSGLSRCLDSHDQELAEKLFRNLAEEERWQLIEILTAVTGPARFELHEAEWAFEAAFNVVNLLCLARANCFSSDFRTNACNQLIETHEIWAGHPSFRVAPKVDIEGFHICWPDMARNLLIRLLGSDACEPVYAAMTGLRYLTEIFPNQISAAIERGVDSQRKRDAVLSLAEIWAFRHPRELLAAEQFLQEGQDGIVLDDRLQIWAVIGLAKTALEEDVPFFSIPETENPPTVFFPGDDGLLTDEAYLDGLRRHNSFAAFKGEQLRRLEVVLGDLSGAKRSLAAAFKSGALETPPSELHDPKFLSTDGQHPRPNHGGDLEFGEAVLRQFSGQTWNPAIAGGVSAALGGDIDPWIATAYPVEWSNEPDWPDSHTVESWVENGRRDDDPVALKLNALISGEDLRDDLIVLGALLSIPTYRRDVQFRYWLEEPSRSDDVAPETESRTFVSRCYSTLFGGWDCHPIGRSERTSVHFVGAMIRYPNTDLEVTPTNGWTRSWNWQPSMRNPLNWTLSDGTPAAKFEQWREPGDSARQAYRQPFLRRWVGYRAAFPSAYDELRSWKRRIRSAEGLLNRTL